jgi:iron(III) transport system permease protein
MCQVPGRRALQWALMLPMAMPSYIVAYVYTDLLDYSGPLQAGCGLFGWQGPADYWFPAIRSLGGAAWVLALVLFPYVYLLTRASFLEQSVSLIHSSRLLGCTPGRAFAASACRWHARPSWSGRRWWRWRRWPTLPPSTSLPSTP